MKKTLLVLAVPALLTLSCYFGITPVNPSPAAFHIVADSPFFTNGRQAIVAMATDGTTVVAVSYEGTIAFSPDHGVTWHLADPLVGAFCTVNFNDVAWGEGYFLAGGDFGRAAWSRDGRTWYSGVIGPMSPRDVLAVSVGSMHGQLVFIAGGTGGRIAYSMHSPEGPWLQVPFSPFGDNDPWSEAIHAISHGRIDGFDVFIAVGDTGNVGIMKNFSGNLYGPSPVVRQTLRGVAFGNERFIAVGDAATMMVSLDPRNYVWNTVRETGFVMRPFVDIAFYPGLEIFVLVASGSVVGFSSTGESWSAAVFTSHFAQGISAAVGTERRIVLGGADGVIAFSN
ncbi:MAG: hypothetical protein FWD88_03195 [Treponema sp.]|nr:hypothetical protein [Treponema sp.]